MKPYNKRTSLVRGLAPCLTGKYKNKKPQLGRLDKPHSAGQICEGFIFLATAAAQSSSRTDGRKTYAMERRSHFEAEVVGWYLVISPHVAAEVRCKKTILDDEF